MTDTPRVPDFYLVTGEPEDDWTYARGCTVHGSYRLPHGEYIWITVEPGVACFAAGIGKIVVTELLISARYRGDSLVGHRFPMHVNVYRILNYSVLDAPWFEAGDVQLLCSAEIHHSREAAKDSPIFHEPLDLSFLGREEHPVLSAGPQR